MSYFCPEGHFLFESDATVGRVKYVFCKGCGKRRTVYLGGFRSAAEVAEARRRESA